MESRKGEEAGKNGEEGPVRLQRKEATVSNHTLSPVFRLWDMNNGSIVNSLFHHSKAVFHLKFTSHTIATCSEVLDYILYYILYCVLCILLL